MSEIKEHPFSDLHPDQISALIAAARVERANAVRAFVIGLFRRRAARSADTEAPIGRTRTA